MAAAASPTYGWLSSWRNILSASAHNCWLLALPMLVVLSHRNIVGGMVLMVVFGTFLQPGFWPATLSWLRPSRLRAGFREGGPEAILALLALFSAWMFLSVLWTPLKDEVSWAWQLSLFFAFSAAFLWTVASLPAHMVTLLARFMLGAGLVAILALGLEAVTGGGVRDLIPPEGRSDKDIVSAARGTTIAICLLPGVLYLWWCQAGATGRLPRWAVWTMAAVLVACLAGGAVAFGVTANVLALAAVLAAGAVTWMWPRTGLWLVFTGFVAALLLAPFVAAMLPPLDEITRMDSGPTSWVQRLGIWRFTADHIFSGPASFLFGGGVNYSQALSNARTMIVLPGYPLDIPIMPTHPHCIFLQLWLEFGLVGVALVIGALWTALKLALKLAGQGDNRLLVAATASIAAPFFVICLVDASLWTPWRLAAPVWALYFLIAGNRGLFASGSR